MRLSHTLLAVIISTFSLSAFAINFSFLNDSAISYFTQEDHDRFDAAWKNALDNAPDGKKVAWSNSSTGSKGYFVPVNRFMKDKNTCRLLKMFYESHGQTSRYEFTFCKIHNEWKVT